MQTYTASQYTAIAVANHFGLDRRTWDFRLSWFDRHSFDKLCDLTQDAKEPILYAKALRAYRDIQDKLPIGFPMELDATASGLQIMACLSGCEITARNTNLIFNGERNCAYEVAAQAMNRELNTSEYLRDDLKAPTMTTFYGSTAQPVKLFGKDTPQLHAYQEMLYKEFPGAMEVMDDIFSCWQNDQDYHKWTLPDGHTAYVPVTEMEKTRIEIDSLKTSFTFQREVQTNSDYYRPLVANIIHSIDGYVVREMVRRAAAQGFQLVHIHDCFKAMPKYMNNVRQNYLDILREIAASTLLQDILREITGNPKLIHTKRSTNLADLMVDAEYALS